MEKRDGRIGCREAREMDMVAYLSGLGHEPLRIRGDDFWYLSPLRHEKTASFKVNRRLNSWYDFGLGEGGSLIDFAIGYHGCTIGEFLATLNDAPAFQRHGERHPVPALRSGGAGGIEAVTARPLFHPALLDYLHGRRIPVRIADHFCREVHFDVQGRNYFAIGFANDRGGYELRNAHFKGSSSPKAITTIGNVGDGLCVFEGFIDFLSFLAVMRWEAPYPVDFLVLNSIAFFERSMPLMEGYGTVQLFLDNDAAGQHRSRIAMGRSDRFVDGSGLYRNHKDLNELLTHPGGTGYADVGRNRTRR